VSGTNVAIRWFCENCDKVVMAKSNATESHNDKIDHLIAVRSDQIFYLPKVNYRVVITLK